MLTKKFALAAASAMLADDSRVCGTSCFRSTKVDCDAVMNELNSGKKAKEVATDLNISTSSVYRCKRHAKEAAKAANKSSMQAKTGKEAPAAPLGNVSSFACDGSAGSSSFSEVGITLTMRREPSRLATHRAASTNSTTFIAMPKCELCELRDYTQRYADFVHPFKFTILDCDSCDTPMAVLGDHRAVPTDDERAFMIEALSLVARAKYGADKFGIDDVMRQIPDHCHMHARPIRRWQY